MQKSLDPKHQLVKLHKKKYYSQVNARLDSLRNHLEILQVKTACESLKQQQDSCQRLAKHKPEKLPNVTFGIHKNKSLALRHRKKHVH